MAVDLPGKKKKKTFLWISPSLTENESAFPLVTDKICLIQLVKHMGGEQNEWPHGQLKDDSLTTSIKESLFE